MGPGGQQAVPEVEWEAAVALPTEDQALDNAARLLGRAEMELTNLPLMERLEGLADSWLSLAQMLRDRERI